MLFSNTFTVFAPLGNVFDTRSPLNDNLCTEYAGVCSFLFRLSILKLFRLSFFGKCMMVVSIIITLAPVYHYQLMPLYTGTNQLSRKAYR